jgi:hypothetical protein
VVAPSSRRDRAVIARRDRAGRAISRRSVAKFSRFRDEAMLFRHMIRGTMPS